MPPAACMDETLMEGWRIRSAVKPQILLVVDTMTGRDAVSVTASFNENCPSMALS